MDCGGVGGASVATRSCAFSRTHPATLIPVPRIRQARKEAATLASATASSYTAYCATSEPGAGARSHVQPHSQSQTQSHIASLRPQQLTTRLSSGKDLMKAETGVAVNSK
ncbi:unnamed protein product [Soboliphyme baturini]|uniref:Uncharacterized protein n=1 Tax=Soboliphyme baturini TaxID=241478 RepID=A0A183IM59_9BILA|nr:unnamed protein product [Soboliphyme baturini]